MSTTTTVNRQFRLAARPVGLPTPDVWELVGEPGAEPGAARVLVAIRYLSLDPAMRAWIDDRPSYLPAVGMGEVMRALGVGEVIASADERFAVGDYVTGLLGVQELAVAEGRSLTDLQRDMRRDGTRLT